KRGASDSPPHVEMDCGLPARRRAAGVVDSRPDGVPKLRLEAGVQQLRQTSMGMGATVPDSDRRNLLWPGAALGGVLEAPATEAVYAQSFIRYNRRIYGDH